MAKPICEYPDCGLEAEHKCDSCGRVYCVKHIANIQLPWLKQWICTEDLRKKVDSQKQIANAGLVAGGIGLLMLLLNSFSQDSSLLCLGVILTSGGFGTGGGMGIRYLSTRRPLSELFPEQKAVEAEPLKSKEMEENKSRNMV